MMYHAKAPRPELFEVLGNAFIKLCRILYDLAVSTITVEIIVVLALVILLLADKAYYNIDWQLLKDKRKRRRKR